MTVETFDKLCSAETISAVETSLERLPSDIALDKHIADAAVVATQVKYLQRAKSKLPSYFAARCILPPLSFEQASSEAVASAKAIEGEAVLDLTCGLGVDSLYLSKRFARVVSIERDKTLAKVARENFRRLGVENIEVINTSAEEYLATCNERFDWIYADPDRRSDAGKKLVRLEDCSPNILALKADIERISAGRVMIKNSPLFDVDEALRLFSPARVEVVSLRDECKEVIVSTAERDILVATAIGKGSFEVALSDIVEPEMPHFDMESYRYLLIPDVAIQKSRLARMALSEVADIWSNNGFGFARTMPEGTPLARIEEIQSIEEYSSKELRRRLAGEGYEIYKRDIELSITQIAKQLKIKQGGRKRIAVSRVGGSIKVITLK